MKKIQGLLFAFCLLCFSCVIFANPSTTLLAVVEENAGHVSFYDPQTGKKWGSLQLGFLPHEIAVTKDAKTAYVSNFGIKDYDSGAGIPGASISIIDIANRVEKNRLYTFNPASHNDYAQIDGAPHGVKLRPPFEKQLFVNVEKGNKVLVFDLDSQSIIKKFNVSPNTHNLFFSPDGKTLWLMAGKEGVIRMDPDTGKVTGTFASSSPIRGLSYTPDNRYLMLSAVNQIVFVDPISLSIKKEFNHLSVGPILYSAITPNQKYIVAPAAFDNQVIIIEVSTGKVVKRIVTGLNPVTAVIDAKGEFAFITNATDKHVTKINMQTLQATKLYTKDGPNGITFVPFSPGLAHHPLTLGVALPLSGQDAAYGRDMMRGYEYWRLLVEQAGGLLVQDQTYDINIIYLDTQSNFLNIGTLTQALIHQYHVNILLSTYGVVAYNFEKQIALENNILITPAALYSNSWVPNDSAIGEDFFITTHFYDQRYYTQYNFKASAYSAAASALGIALQKALLKADNFDYTVLSKILEQNKFNIFYQN